MSNPDSRTAVETALKHLLEQVPALKPLKLIAAAEVHGGRDTQLVRIEMPGPKVTKELAPDARVTLDIRRDVLNDLVDADIQSWVRAWNTGRFKATGVDQYLKLIGQVVGKTAERARQHQGAKYKH
ncbi:hypothetical protein PAI11_09090 [Patulibacter medicamentivorans]|jgi:hypothetical protein|uniref:SCP2 domain-containing protein n=1 Tax=Patulibacter medicamentivorans TaxID=1097667 RepID=H0E296_9ACTN|nr:hypothetical protein [Patulibacter medicamentivorans]EHN12233.1 hypothetical protein PAI11_09090 [Patulibacter medicamentivorans]